MFPRLPRQLVRHTSDPLYLQRITIMPRSRLYSNLPVRKPYPLLSKTPRTMAYIKPCKCSQFQPYVHLHPEDPDGDNVIGSLDPIMAEGYSITDENLDYGEVEVSSDGLLHPETAFPKPLGYRQPSHLTRFVNITEWDMVHYLVHHQDGMEDAARWGKIPEVSHVWIIPKDTALPDGLHLSAEPCTFGCDEREERCKHQIRGTDLSDLYSLQLSKPMTLQDLNHAMNDMLAKSAESFVLNYWNPHQYVGKE